MIKKFDKGKISATLAQVRKMYNDPNKLDPIRVGLVHFKKYKKTFLKISKFGH